MRALYGLLSTALTFGGLLSVIGSATFGAIAGATDGLLVVCIGVGSGFSLLWMSSVISLLVSIDGRLQSQAKL